MITTSNTAGWNSEQAAEERHQAGQARIAAAAAALVTALTELQAALKAAEHRHHHIRAGLVEPVEEAS